MISHAFIDLNQIFAFLGGAEILILLCALAIPVGLVAFVFFIVRLISRNEKPKSPSMPKEKEGPEVD